MTYEITLLEAEIRDPMEGSMRLGLCHDLQQQAELSYRWDHSQFTATFVGHAPTLPQPAHPTLFLRRAIEAIQALKEDRHTLPTDVFKDHQVFMETNQ